MQVLYFVKDIASRLKAAVNDASTLVDIYYTIGSLVLIKKQVKPFKEGDTALHLAASRGFKDICECIIGMNGERKYLIDIDNNNGESPLFLAALSWQKRTFVYLFNFKPSKSDCDVGGNYSYSKDLIRSNGDSIIHCAIRREFFDLALIIIDKYPDLIVIANRHGFSPLKLLATRPSTFKSGCKMIWWKRILYHCIPVGILNVEEAVKYCAMKQYESSSHKKCPKNYDTCYLFLQKCKEYAYPLIPFVKRVLMKETTSTAAYGSKNIEEKHKVFQNYQHRNISMQSKHKLLPENYATCLWFIKFAYIYTLGLSGVGVEKIKKMKQKHKWSGQLLNRFMENAYESYLGTGTKPIQYLSGTDFISAYKPNQGENNSEECEHIIRIAKPGEQTRSVPSIQLNPLENGMSYVAFDLSLSLLQAFAICIALVDSKMPCELSRTRKSQTEELKAFGKLEDIPTSYVSNPPVSPVGRV
ncbi:hypothetical protein RYX36_031755 [Vicia faba]